jgi:predicted 2-oxoglutarate/Fe(II)-dependent dioxygenase YbiX
MNPLLKILDLIEKPGSFCTSASIPACFLGLEVTNIGSIGLPLSANQAKELIAQCQQAPFGRGEKTVVDTDVRRVWELEPSQFAITNPQWQQQLKAICDTVQTELGVIEPVVCELYKLLVYETGSFFVPHRDTEKMQRMFATLVVVLPSEHEGGELVICHDGQEKRFAFGGKNSAFEMRYVAFYADCQHEVTPITAGYRVCLVYNLALAKSTKQPLLAPKNSAVVDKLTQVLGDWAAQALEQSIDNENENKPPRPLLAVLLEHQYTEAELGFQSLKNLDRVYAQVLAQAAQLADCQAHLALVTLWESGYAESDSYDYYDDDDYEMGEIYDSSLTVNHWIDAAGKLKEFGEISLREEQIVSKTALNEREPDEQEVEGPTGNEGTSMDRWYHQAAMVIWPNQAHFSILLHTGQYSAFPHLQDMLANQPADLTRCREFANLILEHWRFNSLNDFEIRDADTIAVAHRMLLALKQMADSDLLVRFCNQILLHDFSGTEGSELRRVCEQYGWANFSNALLQMSTQTQLPRVTAFSQLLADFCTQTVSDEQQGFCTELAQNALDSLGACEEKYYYGHDNDALKKQAVSHLFKTGYCLNQVQLLEQLGQNLTKVPQRFDLRSVLFPVVIELKHWLDLQSNDYPSFTAFFLQPCLERLKDLATLRIDAPKDWQRAADLSCHCADCTELVAFLSSPLQKEHRFRMRQDRRDHLEAQMQRHQSDVTRTTDRKGSPHTLVCVKNQASYERAKQQQALDIQMWHELQAC